jgi:UV DNA damage endonuclease
VLRPLYADNIERLRKAITFCKEQEFELYRLSSALFPFADDPIGHDILGEFAEELLQIGEDAAHSGIRLVIHPDQYVVLSSESPATVANSIKILEHHARTLDLLGQPRSAWAAMNIHGGKSGRANALVEEIGKLSEGVRSRLTLENDESAYGAAEILDVCRRAGVPMTFDAHHHICREKLESYEHPSVGEILAAARDTWPHPEWQMVHISNGRSHFNDSAHSELITRMPSCFRNAPWIEVEAKAKEDAIALLRKQWLAGGQ